MTPLQRLLFGSFPRKVGTPVKFPVFSEEHFDRFYEKCNGRKNVYCTISRITPKGAYCDKISYDFDADIDFEMTPEIFQEMRDDPSFAEEVLGEVISDVKRLIRYSTKEDIPVVGVYSGKGVHVHQLYREEFEPKNQLISTANRLKDELELETLDEQPIGDVVRIVRVPNAHRVYDGEKCDVRCIPLSAREMGRMSAEWLLQQSTRPKPFDVSSVLSKRAQRPEMRTYDDYLHSEGYVSPYREIDADGHTVSGDGLEWLIRDLIKMPCVYERVLSNNPDHTIRHQFAVMMFNIGFRPREVLHVIRKLNWVDFNRKETKKQLKQIYKSGYSDRSCRTLMSKGFCTRLDNPKDCPTYRWRNGNCEWKT